jgi:hypothetical protein
MDPIVPPQAGPGYPLLAPSMYFFVVRGSSPVRLATSA